MEKLGVIREDITPQEEIESREKTAFECDNEKEGQSALIDRAVKKVECPSCKCSSKK